MAKKDNKQTKEEKALLQQQRAHIFKDRKKRIFYIEPKKGTYYRLNPQDEGSIYLYDSKVLFSMLPLTLSVVLPFDIVYPAVVAMLIYFGFEVFYQLKIKNINPTNTLPQEVMDAYISEPLAKSRKTDLGLKFMMVVLVVLLILSHMVENKIAMDVFNIKSVGIYLAVMFEVYVGVDLLITYRKVLDHIRKLKA